MKRNTLPYIILSIGTLTFSVLIYFFVQTEKNKIPIALTEDTAEFNKMAIEETTVYSKPDKSSSIIITISSDTKVKAISETKFYFRVNKINGHNISDGYISKKKLKRLE